MHDTLRDQREAVQRSWVAHVAEGDPVPAARPDVLASWDRSARAVSPDLSSAPVAEPETVAEAWEDSAVGRASRVIIDDLTDLAADGDLMAAITDETVTIAWAAGGPTMTRKADQVHFTRGGCWDEAAVGTNALALARHTARPATVFSAEHFAPMVHDWVCYSAPLLDPSSQQFLGVIDLSTTWDRAHPALLATVRALARCVEQELRAIGGAAAAPLATAPLASAPLALTTLGTPSVRLGDGVIAATRRQLELLTILSLHPEGLTLDELTGRLYGDQRVSPSTVKAELSHLRHLLGGRIASRPYRLTGPVESDHVRLLEALAADDLSTAVALYGGPLLMCSDSPEVETWRDHIDVAIRDATLSTGHPELLFRLSARCVDDVELQEAAMDALPPGDIRRSIAAGRLAAARRS